MALLLIVLASGASAQTTAVAQIRKDAQVLLPLVNQNVAKTFLKAAADLPAVKPRQLLRDPVTKKFYTQTEADKLDAAKRAVVTTVTIGEEFYYNTRYGSPLAYIRPLEILGEFGLKDVAGKKILDYGYGTIGHLRLFAYSGAKAVGVDVDPLLLPSLYGDTGDQGIIRGSAKHIGSITLIDGSFPGDAAVKSAVGGDFDIILSKNTLKNGYLHPTQPVDKRLLVDLGVPEAVFLNTLYTMLKPGGKLLIYNLSPAPNKPGEPYKPWADGKSPFTVEQWKSAGFKVLVFDKSDDDAARKMGHALDWDTGSQPMNLAYDLFTHYTLVEKPKP